MASEARLRLEQASAPHRIGKGKQHYTPVGPDSLRSDVGLEICNLGNAEDRAQIQTRENREAIAAAIQQGIVSYFGAKGGDAAPGAITVAGR